jgi:Holliday junction resolvasome RuvABC DNA-binding subunit
MAKKTIKPKPRAMMLPEVKVTATRLQKPKPETVKLYPKGSVEKRQIDSLSKVGYGKAIGKPIMKKGEKPMYGADSSDIIKKALKRK